MPQWCFKKFFEPAWSKISTSSGWPQMVAPSKALAFRYLSHWHWIRLGWRIRQRSCVLSELLALETHNLGFRFFLTCANYLGSGERSNNRFNTQLIDGRRYCPLWTRALAQMTRSSRKLQSSDILSATLVEVHACLLSPRGSNLEVLIVGMMALCSNQ